jgi:hypothetical protein
VAVLALELLFSLWELAHPLLQLCMVLSVFLVHLIDQEIRMRTKLEASKAAADIYMQWSEEPGSCQVEAARLGFAPNMDISSGGIHVQSI